MSFDIFKVRNQIYGQVVLIEIKFFQEWKREWTKNLLMFVQDKQKIAVKKMLVVYIGTDKLNYEGVEFYPVDEFLAALFKGEIF